MTASQEPPRARGDDWLQDAWEWMVGGNDRRDDTMDANDSGRAELERRFDSIGWGLLFILFGALAMPSGTTEYAVVAGVGALMLALNGARLVAGVPVRWFSIVLGSATLVAGAGALAGVGIDAFVVFFVLLGTLTIGAAIVKPMPPATASRS